MNTEVNQLEGLVRQTACNPHRGVYMLPITPPFSEAFIVMEFRAIMQVVCFPDKHVALEHIYHCDFNGEITSKCVSC